jgi:hypothetical protein
LVLFSVGTTTNITEGFLSFSSVRPGEYENNERGIRKVTSAELLTKRAMRKNNIYKIYANNIVLKIFIPGIMALVQGKGFSKSVS